MVSNNNKDSNNSDEVWFPVWLTTEYLENIVRKYKKDNSVHITNLEITPAIPKGENYASVMTRVKFSLESKDPQSKNVKDQMSVLVKTSHENDPFIKTLYEPYRVFETEMRMYEVVLPALSSLLKEIGETEKLFAETIHVDYENEAIIFEDLSVYNFCIADRIQGLDMDHTKWCLKKLAQMHATAAVLNERTKGSLEDFTRGIFNRYTRGFHVFFENVLEVCADFAAECPDLGLYYAEKLRKLRNHVMEYGENCTEPRQGQFNTLNHGDFWVNNIMLRYNEDQILNGGNNQRSIREVILIDFQFCKWASPALDLHYFLNTSLENDLRFNRQDELVQYYHSILVDTMKQLKFKGHIPTLHEFSVQFEAGRFGAVTSSLVVQAFMINDNTEDADIQSLLMENERAKNFRKMIYRNKIVHENVKRLLPFFDRRGLLDVVGKD